MATVSLRRKIALLICPEAVARQAAAISRLKIIVMGAFRLVNELVEKLDPNRPTPEQKDDV